MTITAKFSSICPACSQRILVGEKVEWIRGQKARHTSCPWTPDQCEHPQFHRTGCLCARQFSRGMDADDRAFEAWIKELDRRMYASECQDDGPAPPAPVVRTGLRMEPKPLPGWMTARRTDGEAALLSGAWDFRPAPIVTREAAVAAWLAAKGYSRAIHQEEVA